MDIGNLIPFGVLVVTIIGGLWAVYSKLDSKIDDKIEYLRTALAKEIGDLRERIDKLFDTRKT